MCPRTQFQLIPTAMDNCSNYEEKFLPPTPPPSYEESQKQYFLYIEQKPNNFMKQVLKTEFGPKPQMANCMNCGKSGITVVQHKVGNKTNIAALLMFMSGLWCFCLMPYYIKSLQYPLHHCTHCGHFLGTCDR